MVKPLHKYCPVASGTAFGTKFLLDAKVQKSSFFKGATKLYFKC